MNGTDDKLNIVKMTAREHFICHMLLCKIYPKNTKLLYALWRLINSKGRQGYKITARTYEVIKKDLAIERSKSLKGKLHTEESKLKMSLAQKGISKSPQHKQQMSIHHANVSGSNNPMHNKHHTKEAKEKFSQYAKLRIGDKNSFFNKHHTEKTLLQIQETKLKNNSKSKFNVYCSNNKKTYLSLRDVEKDLNINRKKVALCCRNKLNEVNGYNFEFIINFINSSKE
jgi:hypothetical protein